MENVKNIPEENVQETLFAGMAPRRQGRRIEVAG